MKLEAVALTVRDAGPDDLSAVADVFLACWRAYEEFLPGRLIDMYDASGARALWRRMLTFSSGDVAVIVAEGAGAGVVGVARIGTDPDEPAMGHVHSLYVRPDSQGLGVGRRLLAEADARFRRDGVGEATLWVFAANAPALGFYARLGWQPDGAQRVEPQFGEPELRLRRPVELGEGDAPGR